MSDVSPEQARAALEAVERGRRQVIDEIALPAWYWSGLALGWVALGVLTDLDHPWLTTAATFAFGAVHAGVAPRAIDGRRRSDQLQVRRSVVGSRATVLVIATLVVLGALTVAGALAVNADGARHPVTIASVAVAVAILLGGPRLLTLVRHEAIRDGAPV